jgi:formylglycine-generating enzyme required for sulfatase activity
LTYANGNIVAFGNASYMALGSIGTNSSPITRPSLWTVFAALPEVNNFGTGTNSFTLDFVTIGNPGNPTDTTGYGWVPYTYQVGTYDISVNQLNAATANGVAGLSNGYWTGDQPASWNSWYQAAAFVNWLNTSQGYAPAYNLTWNGSSYTMALWPAAQAWTLGGTNLYRNANCCYFLPSENEWYKAAYYDPTLPNSRASLGRPPGGYWHYPQVINTAPTAVASGTTAGTAVYNQTNSQSPASVFQAGGLSPYGTMGQGGNVFQWMESAFSGSNTNPAGTRVIRGGSWSDTANNLQSSNRSAITPDSTGGYVVGFRVARIHP